MAARPAAPQRAPVETVVLASVVGCRQLSFYHESLNDSQRGILRVVEENTNERGEMSTTRLERFLNLGEDAILPLYTICGEPRTNFDIQVNYFKGNMPVIYPMRDRKEALRCQRFITGYRTVEHFEGISCSVFFRGPLGVFWRDGNLQGKGELQFWRAEDKGKPSFPATETLSTSLHSPPGSSSGEMVLRKNSAIVVQSDRVRDKGLILSVPPPKPILVVFLGNASQYIMMRMDAIDLACRRTTENKLELSDRKSSTFSVTSLSVAKDRLSQWGLSAMMDSRRHPGTEDLKCTNLSIAFPSTTVMENFEKRLAFLRYQWHNAHVASKRFRHKMDTGKLPTTPDSRSRASMSSLSSLPVIPGLSLTTDEEWRQLEAEIQTRELDGSPLTSIHEMPVSGEVVGARELDSPSPQPWSEELRAQVGETPYRVVTGGSSSASQDGTFARPLRPREIGGGGREPPPVGAVGAPSPRRSGFKVVKRPY